MRKKLDMAALLLAAIAAAWVFTAQRAQLRTAAGIMRQKYFPCSAPVTYSIGRIDPRFGISSAALAGALLDAEAVWEAPARRNLFEYRPQDADLTVELVYDYRQMALDKLKGMGMQTDRSLASYKMLKGIYDERSAAADAGAARFKEQGETYKRREAAYNAKVRLWNRRHSLPPAAEYMRMKAEKLGLKGEYARLKLAENELNADIDTLNAVATTLNQLIVQLNLNVQQYNRAGSQLGSYEEGMYRVTGGRRIIEIYSRPDGVQFTRLLAHELGHALGMEHVEEPKALMFRMNDGQTDGVTPADLAELDKVCKRR